MKTVQTGLPSRCGDVGIRSSAVEDARAVETLALTRAMSLTAETAERIAGLLGRIDHITLLPNRVQFVEDVDAMLSSMAQCDRRSAVVVLITLAEAQHFNHILRALGHAYSEEFVRAGAARARGAIGRDIDIYHVSVLSFALVLRDPGGGIGDRMALDLVNEFSQPLICRDIPIDSKVGIGLARFGDRVETAAELLRESLTAAQDSRIGAEGWSWYNRKSDLDHARSFRLLTDLKSALTCDGGELSLNFQPRIDMRSGAVAGAEALLRWFHPAFGFVSPAEFIPLAETSALIQPLTRWVIGRGLDTVAEWRSLDLPIALSVNISPKNIVEPDFVDFVLESCDRRKIAPSSIELEFTEGTLAANGRRTVSNMERLRDAGIALAIDDFGSGYSNMSYLGSLPAHVLKIDQSFVRNLDADLRNETLVQAIIALGHDLGYRVVGEGIETERTFARLAEWGCDEGQGFWMSKPLGDAEFRNWYRQRDGIAERPH